MIDVSTFFEGCTGTVFIDAPFILSRAIKVKSDSSEDKLIKIQNIAL